MISALDVYTSGIVSLDDVYVGRCRFMLRRGKISCTFSYDDAYLSTPNAYAIDPSLPLHEGLYHCDGLPGVMRDSAPDRWGRHLIARRNAAEAMQDNSVPRTLDEVDYLVGVYDATRQGALRYSFPDSTEFLSPQGDVPPIINLKHLMAAAHEVAMGNDKGKQVKELLDAGSGSLGGARPKASIVDEGKLLLAKFSHPNDEWNVMAWEKTALDIASFSGIEVPTTRLVKLGNDSVLVLERFDREGSSLCGARIPYLSAMSLIGRKDGERCDYVDVAEALSVWAANPKEELHKLFHRVTLYVALHNTDDHLRNLGLLRYAGGWHLSPAFDVNINPDRSRIRVTSIFGESGLGEVQALHEFAEACGISPSEARDVVRKVTEATKKLTLFAKKNNCSRSEFSLLGSVVEERSSALAASFR